jgi:hypothetical protein
MAYALNLSQVQTLTEQLHVDLVSRASMLDDKMLEDLQITVTTDVENIDKLMLFNDKGLLARQYKPGAVKKVQLGVFTENPAKVILAVTHPQDNVQQYREKEPFHVNPDGTNNAEKTSFLLDKIAKRHAQDVRANYWYGNEANASLPETEANQVKLGLSLYDGIYTRIAKAITNGTISASIGNMLTTGNLMAAGTTPEQAYNKFKEAYNALDPDLLGADEILAYMSAELIDKITEGYMLHHPQLSPTTLTDGWRFSTMKNLKMVSHASMGRGSQIIFCLPGTLEYICDIRPEGQANITVERNSDDHNLFDYQIQTAQTTRIRDYSPKVFCVNEQVNTAPKVPAGDYIADVFTVNVVDENEGTAEILSGAKDLYQEGDVITIKATPKTNYVFVGWNDGGEGANLAQRNYTFPGGIVNLVAQFEAEEADSSDSN